MLPLSRRQIEAEERQRRTPASLQSVSPNGSCPAPAPYRVGTVAMVSHTNSNTLLVYTWTAPHGRDPLSLRAAMTFATSVGRRASATRLVSY
mmetsp:Transcript_34287/g.57552  ORF Transcript_34287/g.57552 Transcript_34287/m.57552 type:complete len:92 (-) Transcript_34287:1517-1792(-)